MPGRNGAEVPEHFVQRRAVEAGVPVPRAAAAESASRPGQEMATGMLNTMTYHERRRGLGQYLGSRRGLHDSSRPLKFEISGNQGLWRECSRERKTSPERSPKTAIPPKSRVS